MLLEVNNASLQTAYFRLNTKEHARLMLTLCKEMGVYISVGSDAHYAETIGKFDGALQVLEELGFPEELVANTSTDKFKSLLESGTNAESRGNRDNACRILYGAAGYQRCVDHVPHSACVLPGRHSAHGACQEQLGRLHWSCHRHRLLCRRHHRSNRLRPVY